MKGEQRLFNYTKAELAEMANKENFIRDTLEKVVRLSETLDYEKTSGSKRRYSN